MWGSMSAIDIVDVGELVDVHYHEEKTKKVRT
jgi:hypothetical protein